MDAGKFVRLFYWGNLLRASSVCSSRTGRYEYSGQIVRFVTDINRIVGPTPKGYSAM
jgi:hypothetical protein